MSLRQYAAIKLKIPDSGTDWLDEMIRQSLRDDFAAMVAAQCLGVCSTYIWAAEEAYKTADEITRLRGEAGVLMGLLRECLVIVDVCHIEAESTEEREKLGALMNSIHAALHHPTEPLTDWSAA